VVAENQVGAPVHWTQDDRDGVQCFTDTPYATTSGPRIWRGDGPYVGGTPFVRMSFVDVK
jgi:hypothetical protein